MTAGKEKIQLVTDGIKKGLLDEIDKIKHLDN